jgi:hypothetical protein
MHQPNARVFSADILSEVSRQPNKSKDPMHASSTPVPNNISSA